MIELLILYILSNREMTMYAIQKQIVDNFGAYTQPSFGAVKPALTRLEKSGFLKVRKAMSDGGKLSGFYSITDDGLKELRNLLLTPISQNPIQFHSTARIKLSCIGFLPQDERKAVFADLKSKAVSHKYAAEECLAIQSNSINFYQRILLDSAVNEYSNIIMLIESLEKENQKG